MTGCADIAFIKMGSFSQINQQVQALLGREFPDLNLHVIDFNELVRASKPRLVSLWGSALAEYGLRAARDKRALESCHGTRGWLASAPGG